MRVGALGLWAALGGAQWSRPPAWATRPAASGTHCGRGCVSVQPAPAQGAPSGGPQRLIELRGEDTPDEIGGRRCLTVLCSS